MYKTKLTLILAFLFFCGYSQINSSKNFTLDWTKKQLTTSSNSIVNAVFVKGMALDENLLPVFTDLWKIPNNRMIKNFAINNVRYEDFKNSQGISLSNISEELKATFNITKARDQSYAVLYMTPIVIKNNKLLRISSFTLTYTLQPKLTQLLSRNRPVTNSVLANGTWFKFAVDTTGVFKLSRSFLQGLGINTNGLNPQNIRLFGNGGNVLPYKNSDFRYDDLQENAIQVVGEADGKMDANDYVLFYAKGPHSWKGNTSANLTHVQNIYSDKAYYFITIDQGVGKRIQTELPNTTVATQQITTFDDYTFYEKEEENLFAVGQQWLGEDFTYENTHTFSIPFDNIVSSENTYVTVRGVAESTTLTSMDVKVNGQPLFNLNYPGFLPSSLTHAAANINRASLLSTSENIRVEITYNNNGNPSAKGFLDYIEIVGTKNLIANNKQFSFRKFSSQTASGTLEYRIQNKDNITAIWDVTDYINPTIITNQSTDNTFRFNAQGGVLKEYIALAEADYYTPEKLAQSRVENQNLHALKDIDYLLITKSYLVNQAERLASHHSTYSNLTTKVIPLYQIYNEFGSGSPDITAIRDFIKHLYNNASTPAKKIKYVCLFGDSSYDYKDRISGNNNIVPVYEAYNSYNLASSYVTDDYYGMMDPPEGELDFSAINMQDVATGRIPVTSVQEAEQVVSKLLNYYSTDAFGDWRNQITLVADDVDELFETVLQGNMEEIADTIKERKPIFNIKKIYADAYPQENSAGGERYPDVNEAFTNAIERGVLLADYFGHGGEDGLASERILEVFDIQNWRNRNTLPLFITITCELSKFDNPLRLTAGEYMIWNKDGGMASLITTAREIKINLGQRINEKLIKEVLSFNNEDYTIAEALIHVKNTEIYDTQRYFIYFLGDPAMKLSVPKPDIRLTTMNGTPISIATDTLKALSHVYFEGIVTSPSGALLTDFNGEMSATVFDKSIDKTTLVNNVPYTPLVFDALESKIFRGRATVINGEFSFDFVVPRDIRIAYGKGKISLYADNDIIDKAGYNFDITVGGINPNAPVDNVGPTIQLYMNDESFVDGANTNASPLFLAVLADENGINTSITAVDHDIVAILDGDQANPIIMNDFYQTELDDFTNGKVTYPFRNLKPGPHTIKLCAWDTYNNQSCATLNFVVISDQELVLDNVLNYPNPFVNYTEFWFNHNKPNEPLDVQVQIFTVSGKLVKTINQNVETNGTLSRSITWNGLDDFGDKIGKGVYVYKLKVKAVLSNITTEKYEKLVILQ